MIAKVMLGNGHFQIFENIQELTSTSPIARITIPFDEFKPDEQDKPHQEKWDDYLYRKADEAFSSCKKLANFGISLGPQEYMLIDTRKEKYQSDTKYYLTSFMSGEVRYIIASNSTIFICNDKGQTMEAIGDTHGINCYGTEVPTGRV